MKSQKRAASFSGMKQPVEETPPVMQGALVEKIERGMLYSTDELFAPKISQVETIASFNWLRVGDGQVITPGMPPRWTPLERPRKLRQDSGDYYRDINNASYPSHPTEPAVEVIMKMGSRPKAPIDIFACAATLGQLFRFIQGDQPNFRILLDRIGDTVHFTRRNKSPHETIPDIKGYGHTFPESYTTWDASVRGSSSHQRVIQYRFGGLICQLRFEGDGYLPDKVERVPSVKKHADAPPANRHKGGQGELDGLFDSLAVSQTVQAVSDSPLKISTAGCGVSQDALFDLKTRSVMRKADEDAIIQQELHRLWIRQVPTLILAYHERGTFSDIKIIDMKHRVAEWERTNKTSLGRFEKLLQKIVAVVRDRRDGRLEIVCQEGESVLQVRKQALDVEATFSTLTERKWEEWLDHTSPAAGSTDG